MSSTIIEMSAHGDSGTETMPEIGTMNTNIARHGESADTVNNEEGAPDGGYGWTVVMACAIITWWFVGTTYSWGVIQAALVGEGLAKASTLSFVGSLTVACIAILATANAKLVSFVGARNSGLLGVSLLGLGEILGSLATRSVGGLFATIGVLMGVGTR